MTDGPARIFPIPLMHPPPSFHLYAHYRSPFLASSIANLHGPPEHVPTYPLVDSAQAGHPFAARWCDCWPDSVQWGMFLGTCPPCVAEVDHCRCRSVVMTLLPMRYERCPPRLHLRRELTKYVAVLGPSGWLSRRSSHHEIPVTCDQNVQDGPRGPPRVLSRIDSPIAEEM